ncbi:SusF/SusE family outer membrane protein [Aquimarina muelleri]|uniref:SusF/SusE family outer membrane protein n=1 Tax=Aquimarina muelleri TaxID=279356 RepID=UPI003F686A42
MKKISILIFIFITALCFNACVEDEDPTFVIKEEQSEGPLIVTANTTVNLIKDLEAEQVFTLVWEHAGYNINTPITYKIEAAAAGTNFATPQEVAVTTSRFYSWTIGELNSLAIVLGLSPDTEASLELRLISSIGSNGGSSISSNVIAITVTPYATIIQQKNLFLVGNATASGWENDNNNPPLVRDPDNPNEFKYTGKFLTGTDIAFKFLEVLGQWQPQWGTNDGSTLSVNDGTGSDPDSFSVAAEGYYEVTANIEDKTFTIAAYDASTAATFASIGIIGDATPDKWDADTDMTKSAFDEHLWYIQNVTLTDGEMKFRHSNDWPGNWGASTAISGQTTTDGNPPNIPVTAGIYDIWFNDLDGRYIFIPKG